MPSDGTVLKALLQQRHLQEYNAFCREYAKVAQAIDPHPNLRRTYPSKATFHRWLSGDMKNLPHPDKCRVLEAMFQGWKARQLFEPWQGDRTPEPPATDVNVSVSPDTTPDSMAGIAQVFLSRSEFAYEIPPSSYIDNATKVQAAGLSLNAICQSYPDKSLIATLEGGCEIHCLFLAPDGEAIKTREVEEHLGTGHLSTLTRLNIQVLERVRDRLSPEARDRLRVRTYDETIRFNITLVDDRRCYMQLYLPDTRGVDSPTFVIEKGNEQSLYDVFKVVFDSLWSKGVPAWPN